MFMVAGEALSAQGQPVGLPGALVSPQWLQAQLGRVNVLDASFALPGSGGDPAAAFAAQHIAGARFFDIEALSDHANPLPHMLPTPAAFAAALVALGFEARLPTVIYDDGTVLGACRAWWMLRVFGYEAIALLDGGLPAWQAAGLSLTAAPAVPQAGRFVATFRPECVWTLAQVQANLADGGTTLLDARSAARFRGEAAEPRPGLRRGHIPGAVNVPFGELLDPVTRCFKPLPVLRERLQAATPELAAPLVASCGSGVSACVLAFAYHLLGHAAVAVYDGSWAEWGAESGAALANPIMLGA
jgi:thiosulfate/3-mercaptopyruvate sulfurtransferase